MPRLAASSRLLNAGKARSLSAARRQRLDAVAAVEAGLGRIEVPEGALYLENATLKAVTFAKRAACRR
jgi:hypothetical protein